MKLRALAVTVVAAAMFFAGRRCGSSHGEAGCSDMRVDTVVVRDTLRDTVLVPIARHIVRTDTVWMRAARDTVRIETAGDSVPIVVPIERKVYATDDYRAVVEGFRPELVEMELYRRTAVVTKETTHGFQRHRWGIGIQAGYGFSAKGTVPYVGVGIQYSVITW